MYNRGGLLLAEVPAAALNPPTPAVTSAAPSSSSSSSASSTQASSGLFKRLVADSVTTKPAPPSKATVEAQFPIHCALPLPDLAARQGLNCEARVAVGSESHVVNLFDLTTATTAPNSRALPKPVSSVNVGHSVALMRSTSRYICAASRTSTSFDGTLLFGMSSQVASLAWLCASPGTGDAVTLIDADFRAHTRSSASLPHVLAHNGGIIDMDVRGDLLITCGYTTRSDGRVFNDYMVKVRER